MELLNSLSSVHYDFLYKNMRDIITVNESVGNTQVRFVSKALRHRHDSQFRHVSLEFRDLQTGRFKVSEKYSFTVNGTSWRDEFCITLPNIDLSIDEIEDLEKNIPGMYIFGYMDCRHHVHDMLKLCYPIENSNNDNNKWEPFI
jgi:hypothetical protein